MVSRRRFLTLGTLTEIANELQTETNRITRDFSTKKLSFAVSLGAISKALSSLEEQLWIRRQNSTVLVPEPRRLLLEWAEKYKERFRWRLRSSFQTSNPLGKNPSEVNRGLQSSLTTPYAFTGAAAAADAPFIDLDPIDIFLLANQDEAKVRELSQRPAPQEAPKLRFIYPYDEGVFLYCRRDSAFSQSLEHSSLSGFVCARRPRPKTGRSFARQSHCASLEIRMIPEPQRTYLLELLEALGPAADDFVVAGAQAMKFAVQKARGTKDVDFILNVIALRNEPLQLAKVFESLGYAPPPP